MQRATLFLLILLLSGRAAAQPNLDDVEIQVVPVSGHVYMLVGQGGNIGLSVGEDGAFLIDDQFAPLTEKIQAAVASVTDAPIRFVVNTHWHGDHTGGNENLGEAGAILVAHENVRERMSKDHFNAMVDRTTPASPPGALPVVTFTEAMTFHWNGDDLHVAHVAPAHTDGDAFLHFRQANVLHTGDLYFNGFYPYIDVSSGGRLDGMIAAADRMLALADAETRIIPGHGPLSGRAELEAYRDMLVSVRARIQSLVEQGKTADEIVAARPTEPYDAEWGGGFMQPDNWVRIVHASMSPQ